MLWMLRKDSTRHTHSGSAGKRSWFDANRRNDSMSDTKDRDDLGRPLSVRALVEDAHARIAAGVRRPAAGVNGLMRAARIYGVLRETARRDALLFMGPLDRGECLAADRITVELDGHAYVGTRTAAVGFHTGRSRYRVECATCNLLVHPGTTSTDVSWWHRSHVRADGTIESWT